MSRLGDVMQQAGDPRRTPDYRVDRARDFPDAVAGERVEPPGLHPPAHLLDGVLAGRRAEPGEHVPVPGPHSSRPEREPEEGELRALVRAASLAVLAAHDPGFG